jgi:hypothetical protein
MRGLGGISLFLLVMLAGLIWAVTWGPWRDLSFRSPLTKNAEPLVAPPSEAAAQPAPARKGRATAGSAKESASPPAVPESSPPAPIPPAAAKPTQPPKFPTAVDVPLGTLGSTLLESFGPPVGRTIGVDETGRTEIFVYRRTHPDTATVIHLRNGRVASTVTTAY